MQNDIKKIMALLYEIKKRISKLEKDINKNENRQKANKI